LDGTQSSMGAEKKRELGADDHKGKGKKKKENQKEGQKKND